MATASTNGQYAGQILNDDGTPQSPQATPAQLQQYVQNMGNVMQWLTQQSSPTQSGSPANALALQTQGLKAQQAGFATPSSANPLNFLFQGSGYATPGIQSNLGSANNPAILSTENQAQGAATQSANVLSTVNAQEQNAIAAYNETKPVWTLSPQPNADGEWYYYNTNTPPGQQPQTYAAGKIPPGVGGSPGGSPGSANSGQTLVQANNPYGIKMTSTTTDMFSGLGATPGPSANDGGNFWSFPDDSTGEKAARTLLTSSLYANDSVDQALRQWSNYTGTGQYPGYNGSILAGTGVDPNATIKSLTSAQIDVVMAAMKKAENVGGTNNPTPTTGTGTYSATSAPADPSQYGSIAHQIAWGIGGMTYDAGMTALDSMPGGSSQKNNVLKDIQKENPNFNQGSSNQYGENLKLAATIKPNVDAANTIIGKVNSDGTGSPGGLLDLYDQMISTKKTNSGWLTSFIGPISGGSGVGVQQQNAFNKAVTDVVSNVNAVLSNGRPVGVSANNETIAKLFPQDASGNYTMDRPTLIQSISQIQGFMQSSYNALTKNPFDTSTSQPSVATNTPTAPSAPASTSGGDYQSYLQAIGMAQ